MGEPLARVALGGAFEWPSETMLRATNLGSGTFLEVVFDAEARPVHKDMYEGDGGWISVQTWEGGG